jgi:hypothetical protein
MIPFINHPCTLSASLAVQSYCLRFAFAFTNDLETEYINHPSTLPASLAVQPLYWLRFAFASASDLETEYERLRCANDCC